MERNKPLARMHGAGGPSCVRSVALRIVTYQRDGLKHVRRLSLTGDSALQFAVRQIRTLDFESCVARAGAHEVRALDAAGTRLARSVDLYSLARRSRPRPAYI